MNNKYYHVITENPMYIGETICFDSIHRSGMHKRVYGLKNIVSDIYKNSKKYDNNNLEHHTKVALRELAMEEIRNELFPNYPSRLESLYVSETLEEAEKWRDSFLKSNRQVFGIAVVVCENCKVFKGDAWNCFDGTTDKKNNLKLAQKYWNGETNDKGEKPLQEIILSGTIKVLDIIE